MEESAILSEILEALSVDFFRSIIFLVIIDIILYLEYLFTHDTKYVYIELQKRMNCIQFHSSRNKSLIYELKKSNVLKLYAIYLCASTCKHKCKGILFIMINRSIDKIHKCYVFCSEKYRNF